MWPGHRCLQLCAWGQWRFPQPSQRAGMWGQSRQCGATLRPAGQGAGRALGVPWAADPGEIPPVLQPLAVSSFPLLKHGVFRGLSHTRAAAASSPRRPQLPVAPAGPVAVPAVW